MKLWRAHRDAGSVAYQDPDHSLVGGEHEYRENWCTKSPNTRRRILEPAGKSSSAAEGCLVCRWENRQRFSEM
ncbi:hypothetical protein M408DRAFT_333481 [Serendipita vermifera MAFF 305830]|uniref:Uncharacterized protein n=1 Tax=Serendipita vermifera MAFF 305830 TaxID=933852 RepID=A0A0C2WVI4_SERVB|nr:hypothetical protein M408DRAFT_333481 [Serendipita vermifera MAFF 305830]